MGWERDPARPACPRALPHALPPPRPLRARVCECFNSNLRAGGAASGAPQALKSARGALWSAGRFLWMSAAGALAQRGRTEAPRPLQTRATNALELCLSGGLGSPVSQSARAPKAR